MSKKMIGDRAEKIASKKYHQKYRALLISSKLLRRLNCGQVDIAYVDKNFETTLVEVKSNRSIGVFKEQRKRLKRTQDYLSKLFNRNVYLVLKHQEIDFF